MARVNVLIGFMMSPFVWRGDRGRYDAHGPATQAALRRDDSSPRQ